MLGRLAKVRVNGRGSHGTRTNAMSSGYERLADHAMRMVREGRLDTWNLSNLSHGVAKTGHMAPQLLDAVASVAIERIDEFEAQGLSNTSWAFATAGHDAPALFDVIARTVPKKLADFIPQHYSSLVWSYASAGHEAPELFEIIADSAAQRATDFNTQSLANISWAYATVGHSAPTLFEAIATESAGKVSEMKAQELANIAWAFAVNDHLAPALFGDGVFVQRCMQRAARLPKRLQMEVLFQLFQWQLWHREHGLPEPLPEELAQRAHNAFAARPTEPSHFQRQVCDVVKELLAAESAPASVREEVVTAEGYSLDLVVDWPPGSGRSVAIEVDGPSHFLTNSLSPTGSTQLKRRQLQRLGGWQIVSVPHFIWTTYQSREGDPSTRRRQYVRELLDERPVPGAGVAVK